jgi:TolB-like protein/cytochrome c-type biogenesis protein CcmH/NrfG
LATIWDRLKHHKVVQWTVAYLAVAYTLLHGAEMLGGALGWPHGLLRGFTLILILLVPVVITLAWFHGARGQQRASRTEIMVLAVLLAIAGFVLWRDQQAEPHVAQETAAAPSGPAETLSPDAKSIAVLPFADMSPEKDQEYMSDGIAEELLNLLAKAPGLKVIARTSSFSFKGQNVAIAEIARQLNVAHVLEGSVRKSGNMLRITSQLIRATDSTHVWSDTYDRPLDDIFAVQDEIAGAIAKALQIELTRNGERRRNGSTTNLAAYQFYLQAKSDLERPEATFDDVEVSLNKALELDPGYGKALVMLSNVVYSKGQHRLIPLEASMARSRQLLEHALQVSPDLAEAYAILEQTYRYEDFDWAAADKALQRARELDPNDPVVLQAEATVAQLQGRHEEAIRLFRMVRELEPLIERSHRDLADAYYQAGRFNEAEAAYREIIGRNAEAMVRGRLAKVLLAQGKPKDALALVQQLPYEGRYGVEEGLEWLPMMLYAAGRHAESQAALKAQIARLGKELPYLIVQSYAYQGDYGRAVEWLHEAYRQKDWRMFRLFNDPLLKGLAADAGFKAFVRDTLKFPI